MEERKARRLRLWRRVVFIQIVLIVVIFSAAIGMGYASLSKVRIVKISKSDEDLGISRGKAQQEMVEESNPNLNSSNNKENTGENSKSPVKENSKATEKERNYEAKRVENKKEEDIKYRDSVINIALFGVDEGREKWEAVHSDAIMILSLDMQNNKIKLSSIMRDSYVNVAGHGKTKITNAYAYGGPQLAIKTLNQNFDLDIRDFVTVDFVGLANIIDSIGGVRIDVKKNEIEEVNKYIREVAEIRKVKARLIREAGPQNLDGNQAVAYARIRAVGNGDYRRTERQQEVLTALIKKIEGEDLSSYSRMISELLPYVETSMSKMEILKMAGKVANTGISDIEWVRFPTDSNSAGKIIKKVWYLTFNRSATIKQLHKFIYEGVKP